MTDVTMTEGQCPPMLAHLREATSESEELQALRQLKNAVIANPQTKETYVRAGILESLATVALRNIPSSESEDIRYQTLSIMSSLAYGGPALIAPLHDLPVLPILLSHMDPSTSSPRNVTVALQSIDNMVRSTSSSLDQSKHSVSAMANLLFMEPHIGNLNKILASSDSSTTTQIQISLATKLIARLCRDERHQMNLANAGIIASLAQRLAGIVMLQRMVLPDADMQGQENITIPIPRDTDHLAGILEALTAIIADSKSRAFRLLNSSALQSIFPVAQKTRLSYNSAAAADWEHDKSSSSSTRHRTLNPTELLIPDIPQAQSLIHTVRFPPVAKTEIHPVSGDSVGSTSGASTPNPLHEESENPFVPYLIWLITRTYGLQRLMAINLFAALFRMGLINKSREQQIGCFITPRLVQLIVESKKITEYKDTGSEGELLQITERAPAVLAMLILDNTFLQRKASEAIENGLTVMLCTLLKVAYDPVQDSGLEPWSPTHTVLTEATTEPNRPIVDPLLLHKIRVRESILEAIAALISLKDEYRKAIIGQGVMPHIIESLRPFPDKPVPRSPEKKDDAASTPKVPSPAYGINPTSVLIAACDTIRYLSRSVTLLRTTLKDFGVADPVSDLLRHQDVGVQIAATAAVSNLIMEFSPIREDILKAGALDILCEHAHSNHQKLRLNALWALKHLVVKADNDTKKTCLEKLGQDWLVQLIRADADSAVTMDQRSSAVDVVDDAMQIDEIEAPFSAQSEDSTHQIQRAESPRDGDTDSPRQASKGDVEVQEQGLDFIRNLICSSMVPGTSSGREASEMVDFLFNALGRAQLFEILCSKLRVEPGQRPVPPEIIKPVANILINIAASEPRHRQLLVDQNELIGLIAHHLRHPNAEVRVAFCWVIINLTSVESPSRPESASVESAKGRILEEMGYIERLEGLLNDKDLDVRERAKAAVYQVKQLLRS